MIIDRKDVKEEIRRHDLRKSREYFFRARRRNKQASDTERNAHGADDVNGIHGLFRRTTEVVGYRHRQNGKEDYLHIQY